MAQTLEIGITTHIGAIIPVARHNVFYRHNHTCRILATVSSSDKISPPHKQTAPRHKGVISAMDRSKAQEIITQSILEVMTENAFHEAWPREKPSLQP